MLLTWLLTALLLQAPAASAEPRPPARALAAEHYTFETDPARLEAWVREALARELGQDKLEMAAAGAPFSATDVILDRSLPGRRLVLAAVGEKYAVVHYEAGGIAHTREVVVFEKGAPRRLWHGSVNRTIGERAELERAIKDGSLWETPRRGRP